MSSLYFAIMCLIMIALVPLHQLGNADGLEFLKKCVHTRWCKGKQCICCNNAPEILKCYDTQAACMAHCTNPIIRVA
uniref:Pollen coat protein B13 n=1 Tax=Brassica oleracea TaxID=3712 RepID=A0A4Y6I1D1_BRAOL|nr:pollen coat protein B13 [Brassica oleracea]